MIGLYAEGLRRAAGIVPLLLAVCAPVPARADVTPEPRWEQVNVRIDVDAAESTCPQAPEVAAWINDLVGRDFVVAEAPVELTIQVSDASNHELAVALVAVEHAPEASTTTELRRFQRALSCAELLRATALTISLFAKAPATPNPQSADAENTVSRPVAPSERTPVSPTDQVAALESPAGPSAPTDGAPVTEAAPFTPPVAQADVVQPRAAQPAPAVTPVLPLQVDTPSPKATTPPVSVPPAAPRRVETNNEPPWRPVLGAGAHGAVGVNPGIGIGGSAVLGLRSSTWEWLVRGAYSASTGERLTPNQPGTIIGPTTELTLAVCPAFSGFPLLGSHPTLRVCGFGGAVWVYARGDGFERDRRAQKMTPMLGLSSELLFDLTAALAFGVRLDALVPFEPVSYQVLGEPSATWNMWSIAPRIGFGLEWR